MGPGQTGRKFVRHLGLRAVLVGLAALICCGGLFAQQSTSQRVNPGSDPVAVKSTTFELDKENSDRVAAAPQQIREVLAKDPGPLVELKRWISKEATSM